MAGGDSASIRLALCSPHTLVGAFCLTVVLSPSRASIRLRQEPSPRRPGSKPRRSAAHLRGALTLAWPGCVPSACSWAALALTATLNLES